MAERHRAHVDPGDPVPERRERHRIQPGTASRVENPRGGRGQQALQAAEVPRDDGATPAGAVVGLVEVLAEQAPGEFRVSPVQLH
jgi:hypothetical protein